MAEPAAAEMRFDYAPGQYAMSDFSGKTLSLRDKSGGVVDVEIFVAVLPYSNLIYAEAVLDQKINSWAMAHRRALEYFKGVPKCLVIDNLKSGVIRPDREEPHLNATFREFALHYGLATLPARSCRPTDKGAAESAVRTVQSRILLALRDMAFFSLEAMNKAIWQELEKLNEGKMANGESRRALFEARERAALAALPINPWNWGEWTVRTVARNCHISVARNHYSVPCAHIGREVEVRKSERMIEIFLEGGGERIAVHPRKKGKTSIQCVTNICPGASMRCSISVLRTMVVECHATMTHKEGKFRLNLPPSGCRNSFSSGSDGKAARNDICIERIGMVRRVGWSGCGSSPTVLQSRMGVIIGELHAKVRKWRPELGKCRAGSRYEWV